MERQRPTYEELERRLSRAEKALDALRDGQVDAVLGKDSIFLLRMQEVEKASRRQKAVIEGINRIFQKALTCETEEELGGTCLAVAEEITRSKLGFIGELDRHSGMTEGVVVFDPAGNLIDINPAALAIHREENVANLRRHIEELADIFELFDVQDRLLPGDEWPIGRALRGETFRDFEVRVRRKDSSRTWFASYGGTPVLDDQGDPLCFIVTLRDITRRKRTEEELELRVKERTAELVESESRAQTEAEKRRYLAKRLVSSLEEDRRQTAMMLHDEVGQTIAGAKLRIENFHRHLKELDSVQAKQLQHIVGSLQRAIACLRDRSRQLHPSVLRSLGVVPALHSIREKVSSDGCRMHLFFRGVPEPLDHDLGLAIFRIAQEAVLNAVKHSGCDEIHLTLSARNNALYLTVEDDGCGFVWDEAVSGLSAEGPLGLMIMRERAIYVGGVLYVDSIPGKGTTVMAEFPLGAAYGKDPYQREQVDPE